MEKRFEAEIENLQDPNDFYFPGLNPASPPTRNSVTWYTEALSKMDILIAEWSREASLITNEEELAVIEKHIEALNTKRTGYDNIRNNHNSYIVVEKERKKALAAERKLKREAEELAKKEEAERRGAVEIEQARILASTERRNAAAAARAKKQARQAEIEFEIELARRLEARRSSIGSQIMAAAAKVPEENGFNWCPGPNVQSAGDPLYLPATESESGSNVSYELTPTESSSVFKKLGSRLSRSRSNRSYP